jgi:hypothetical protein
MLEGGNGQLQHFFERHNMGTLRQRYHTKAAQFYRLHLTQHINLVRQAGVYQGREASRNLHAREPSSGSSHNPTCNQELTKAAPASMQTTMLEMLAAQ